MWRYRDCQSRPISSNFILTPIKCLNTVTQRIDKITWEPVENYEEHQVHERMKTMSSLRYALLAHLLSHCTLLLRCPDTLISSIFHWRSENGGWVKSFCVLGARHAGFRWPLLFLCSFSIFRFFYVTHPMRQAIFFDYSRYHFAMTTCISILRNIHKSKYLQAYRRIIWNKTFPSDINKSINESGFMTAELRKKKRKKKKTAAWKTERFVLNNNASSVQKALAIANWWIAV